MSTVASTRTRPAPRPAARQRVPVAVIAVSVDDIDAWLRDEEPRLRALVAHPAATRSARDELSGALAELDHAIAVLDQLALDPHADQDLVQWLHTRSCALLEALTATAEHRVLGRAA